MRYKPSNEVVENSNITAFMDKHSIDDYNELIRRSMDIEWYWDIVNKDLKLRWFKDYTKIVDLSNGKPFAKWFTDGKCNITYNCLDMHLTNKPAYIYINENREKRIVTYNQLYRLVNKFANLLKRLNVRKGDIVTIYMPMIPEAIAAMLACSRIGAVHSVIFSGFTSFALASRINDAKSRIVITTDGCYRRGKYIELLKIVREAAKYCKIDHILVYEHAKKVDGAINDLLEGEDDECSCEVMNAEDQLFILYTSGTTGKPKGVVHVHGGFMVFAAQQAAYLIDLKSNDILFWPADIGWITGQTWTVYGSLLMNATSILYDGAPDYPTIDHWFDIIDEENVTIFGTAPTAIRLFMKHDINHRLDSLRILATTGESINKNEWLWYLKTIGKNRSPIMNLSGGTEIGGAILSPLPIMELEPCSVGGPVPGVDAAIFDDNGKVSKKGYLVIKQPWPAMTRGLLNDYARYIEVYWSRFDGVWFHGDYASIKDGLWYLHGRTDDIIKVAGHRIASAEIESVISDHEHVLEAAAIGIPDELKGESIILYVVGDASKEELKQFIVNRLGKIAMPKDIIFVKELPKTRTGKIMRRILRAKFLNKELGDLSNIEDPNVVEKL